MNIFVYGTLRKGAGLSERMQAFEYIGTFQSEPLYTMYDLGCPSIAKEGTTSITGEIYRIENLVDIMPIHRMETSCGYALLPIKLINFNEPVFAYHMKPDWDASIIEGGDWVKYREKKRGV